jgi:hypothetical protein
MNKTEYINLKKLEDHASSCQMAADEMAIQLIEQKRVFNAISVFQSKCDFNLGWLYQLSPEVVLQVDSLEFLADNVRMFKRKLKVSEMLSYDFIIRYKEVTTFNQLIEILKS